MANKMFIISCYKEENCNVLPNLSVCGILLVLYRADDENSNLTIRFDDLASDVGKRYFLYSLQ
jgi:hypothetical protein